MPASPSAPAAGARQAPSDPFAVDPERALEALRLEWGITHTLLYHEGLFCARRLDGSGQLAGEPLSAETPDELAVLLKRDWGEA